MCSLVGWVVARSVGWLVGTFVSLSVFYIFISTSQHESSGDSFVAWSVRWLVCSFVRLFVCSFVRLSVCPFVGWLVVENFIGQKVGWLISRLATPLAA
jgi:hypothetical protein